MYKPKAPKGEKESDSWYTILNNYPLPTINTYTEVNILSIDPAVKNLALRIEKRCGSQYVRTMMWDKISVAGDDSPPYNLIFVRINECLNRFLKNGKIDVVIIERQLPINYLSGRVMQHIITYMIDRLTVPVIEVSPKVKSVFLHAPKGLNKPQLKKWSVEKAYDLLNLRSDTFGLSEIERFKKKKNKLDDLADTLVQSEAFCALVGWPLSERCNVVTFDI